MNKKNLILKLMMLHNKKLYNKKKIMNYIKKYIVEYNLQLKLLINHQLPNPF